MATSARRYQVISTDGHLEVPPDDFVPYIPEAYRDRAPRRIQTGDGGDSWLVEGVPLIHTGANLVAGGPMKIRGKSYWNPDGSRATGGGLAPQRLAEQDRDGVDAEILFPPIFVKDALAGLSDAEAYRAIVQGYNTFCAADYCSVAADRLIPMGVIPSRGLEMAISELKRCKELGLKGVCLLAFPNGTNWAKPEDDEFWATALSLKMPITAHTHFGAAFPPGVTGPQPAASPRASSLCSRQAIQRPLWTVAQLMMTGVFDRFPDLQIYFAETNASWLPNALQEYDENYLTYASADHQLAKLPSQYVRDHIRFSFIKDDLVGKMLDLLPIETLMWGSDFPHSVATFPNSIEFLESTFPDAAVRRRILVDNPVDFFGLDPDAILTSTP